MTELSLYELTAEQQALEQALIEAGGELTEEVAVLLADNAESISRKVDGYQHIIAKFDAFAAACKKEKESIAAKQRVAENAAERIKEHLSEVMSANGITKLEGKTSKAYLRRTEQVQVNDTELIAPYMGGITEFITSMPSFLSVGVKVNKTALKDAIRQGEPVKGAEIVENYTAIVK